MAKKRMKGDSTSVKVTYPHSERGKLDLNNHKETERTLQMSARRRSMTLLLILEETENVVASSRIKLETAAGTEVIDPGISGVFGRATQVSPLNHWATTSVSRIRQT
jgi:hypothetical protein